MDDPLTGHALFSDRAVLEGAIRRLGLDISLEPEGRETLRPARIGHRAVGNRFVIHPMEGCDGTLDGRPDEITFHRWGRFARGGAKVLWGEAVAVLPDARANARQLLLSPATAPDLARLIAFAREEHRKAWGTADDFLVGVQLTHSGRFSHPTPSLLVHDAAVDAVTRVGKERRPPAADHPVLSDEAIDRLQDAYLAAARLARDAGADFIDIKQCHGYLLSEMLAARGREGRYGGSLENRTRFARDCFRRIRAELGAGLLLATRMNCFDGVPYGKGLENGSRDQPPSRYALRRASPKLRRSGGGKVAPTGKGEPVPVEVPRLFGFGVNPDRPLEPDLREPLEAVRLYREAGLQFLNVTLGCPYYNPHIGRPADTPPVDGYGAPEYPLAGVARHFSIAAAIQRAFPDLAVAGTGYSYLRHFAAMAAEANVRAGRITFPGLGRGAIAYPDFVRDLRETGAMDRRKTCITVSYCTTLMRSKGNALGQYAAGCVPRDPVYARLFQEVRRRDSATKAPRHEDAPSTE